MLVFDRGCCGRTGGYTEFPEAVIITLCQNTLNAVNCASSLFTEITPHEMVCLRLRSIVTHTLTNSTCLCVFFFFFFFLFLPRSIHPQVLHDNAKARREVELHWRASGCRNIVNVIDVYENSYGGNRCLLVVMEW